MRGACREASLCYRGVTGLSGSIWYGRWRVRSDVDLRVPDLVALEEIELYAEMLSAVAIAERQLTNDEIDEVLGVHQRERVTQRLTTLGRRCRGGRLNLQRAD